MADDAMDRLKLVPLFAGLARRELKTLAGAVRVERFKRGELLLEEGQTAGRLYVLTSGHVAVSVGGKRLGTQGPNEIIGEMSVLARRPRTATVTADTDVEALGMSSTTFLSLLQEHWEITKVLLAHLAGRLDEAQHIDA